MDYKCKSLIAALPRTARATPLVISGDPKGKTFLYCNGNSVIIRDIENPAISDVYTEHSTVTCVAKYSPSGFYIASGDKLGKLRIWDTTQKEHILKKEYQPIAGAIRDIAWSPDSQRLAVVGEGRERFGHVFLFETGTSNGDLSGQTKSINSVDFRPVKPFRLVTASEDTSTAIFEGPPFKFKTNSYSHGRFAQCVRYSPSGGHYASCGADGKLFLYDGAEGKCVKEFVDPTCTNASAHKGGAYALSWKGDGSRVLTASADGSCKIWNVETGQPETTFQIGNGIEDQQLACLWQDKHLLSVSLSGFINYLDVNDPSKPRLIVRGHSKPITTVALDRTDRNLFTADMEGCIAKWDEASGMAEMAAPKWHTSQVQSMTLQNGNLLTVGLDDKYALAKRHEDKWAPELRKLSSQPRAIGQSSETGTIAIVTIKELVVILKSGNELQERLGYEGACVAVHPTDSFIAVGGQDSKLRLYDYSTGQELKLVKEASHHGAVLFVRFSPDGQYLAACDAMRKVVVYKATTLELAVSRDWGHHSARVNCLAWSPNSRYIASGGLDTNIIIWDMQQPAEYPLIMKGAHTMSQITGIEWIDESSVVSTGQDAMIKVWQLKLT